MKPVITILFVIILAVLFGCATSSRIYLPNGSQGYRVNCDGSALDWGMCYEKAGELCGSKGYVLVGQNGESYPLGSANASNAQFTATYGAMVTRYMLIKCNE